MSIATIREYVALLWAEYQDAKRPRRGEILDALCRNLDIHRKSATRLMNTSAAPRLQRGKGSGGREVYDSKAKAALRDLWREVGYIGAARLKAALPEWLPHFESAICDEATRGALLKMSSATIERTLKVDKAALRRRLNTDDLEVPLKEIFEKSRLWQSEKGVNPLHVVIGFMEKG